MKKGKWHLGLIVVALVALLAVSIGCVKIVIPAETAQPAGSSSGQTTQQSGFLTHSDTKNGFSISFPQDWEKIPQTLVGGVATLAGAGENFIVGFWAPAKTEHGSTPNFTIAKVSLPYEQNLEGGYDEIRLSAEQEKGYVFVSKDNLTVNGIAAIKYVYRTSGMGNLTRMYILLMQGNVAWLITFTCADQSFNSLEPTFDTIVSSFRISGASTTASPSQPATTPSGFRTHTDKANGFSISYPANWDKAPQEIMPENAVIGFRSLGATRIMLLVHKSFLPHVTNVQSAYEEMKTAYEAQPGYRFISRDDMTIDGIPAFKYVFQVDFSGTPTTLVYLYLVQGNSDWLVQLGCSPVQSYTQYKPTFDAILNSFHILNN